MSVPDPDEIMDTHAVEEPIDENGFEASNANEIDDDFPGIGETLPPAAHQDRDSASLNPSVQVVNSSPVDLDSLVTTYKGYGLINRLFFIAEMCPPMKSDALTLLLDYIVQNTLDTTVYTLAFEKLEGISAGGSSSDEHRNSDEASRTAVTVEREGGYGNGSQNITGVQRNMQWVETTNTRATARFDALFSEFKRQKEEGVKESTRRAMDELFQHQVQMGRLQDAVKLFSTGVRDYCTTPKHVIQMLLSWIEVSIYLNQWHRVDPLVAQVERAITEAQESEASASTLTRGSRYHAGASQMATKNMKEFIDAAKAKVAGVSALYRLYTKAYKMVAEKCLQIDLNFFNYPNLLSAKDIAVYGTLCALATFDRTDLKSKVLGSPLFRKFLDSEPKLIELLQKFVRGAFGPCLDIMEESRDQLLLNLYLSSHLKAIYRLIRRRAVVQYFTPFAAADIRKMATVFRVTIDELEDELVDLIDSGAISARIDSYNKVLYAKQSNNRVEVYQKALRLGRSLSEYANGAILHAALHEAQICVGQSDSISKGPRRRPAQGGCEDLGFGKYSAVSDDFGDRMGSSSSSSASGARSIMSRIFVSGRSGTVNSSQAPMQSAEADSSNEKGMTSSVKMAKVSTASDDVDVENTNSLLPMNVVEDVPMASHNENSEDQQPPPVPFPKQGPAIKE